jgi:hypothetical protein
MNKPNNAAVNAALARGPPDLQGLVIAHGFFSNIPGKTWRRYDDALSECKRRLRAKHVAIKTEQQGNLFALIWE